MNRKKPNFLFFFYSYTLQLNLLHNFLYCNSNGYTVEKGVEWRGVQMQQKNNDKLVDIFIIEWLTVLFSCFLQQIFFVFFSLFLFSPFIFDLQFGKRNKLLKSAKTYLMYLTKTIIIYNVKQQQTETKFFYFSSLLPCTQGQQGSFNGCC